MRVKKQTLKEKAYEYIKNKIINCEYAPNAFINEEMIASELSVSRTPIREALMRLEQEQLINILPKRGIIVCPLTPDLITSIFETRLLIEPFIIENYGQYLDKNKLLEFKKLYEGEYRKDRSEFEIDDEFHGFLSSCSKNTYLVKTLENTTVHNQRIRIYSGIKVFRVPRTYDEHIHIISALLEDDYKLAANKLREHILQSRKNSLEIVFSS
ncbi:MAG: GntR family transcriptional regulator [Pleomorphochaeta sp.]